MDIVRRVLDEEKRELEKFKSIQVEKHLEAKIDLGYLLCADPNELDEVRLKWVNYPSPMQHFWFQIINFFFVGLFFRSEKDTYLAELARDNVQLIVNALWEQPTERVEECIVAKLPAPTFVLPRKKKCPVPRPLTKWEKFAQEKGIVKKKKDTKVFDDVLEVRIVQLCNVLRLPSAVYLTFASLYFCSSLSIEMGSYIWFPSCTSWTWKGLGAWGTRKCRSNGRSIC